ncbi:MAG: hypothetical protein LBI84_04300 [Propionibacteriaceae bacterium]|jgi:hypothetical protein|nr:hypothetical protein [Propionibacteriaceae bacterium]
MVNTETSTRHSERAEVLSEIILCHVALAVFLAFVGFLVAEWAVAGFFGDALRQSTLPVTLSVTHSEMWGIFFHNIAFFLAVSVLPMFNSVVVAAQFFILGAMASLITNLPPSVQFEIFYRHALLEVAALLLAVAVSYVLYFSVRQFIKAPRRDTGALKWRLLPAIPMYAGIVTLTLIGAILEGSVFVRL